MKKRRFELRLTEGQSRALGEIAKQLEMTKAEVIRSLIDAIEHTNEKRMERAKEIIQSAYGKAIQDADWYSSDDVKRRYNEESFKIETDKEWEEHLELGLAIAFARVIDKHAISVTEITRKVEEQLKSL